ncbi:retrovirus-related pol polyprotein from transposon 412 [Plakobranchus ocellatus]|uniref:Retrovirus-related pol polyprotein from transposon 412 n=1 Tax=Plakobranchus ocellatus TaxID=259542 RepID=A0AAV4BK76_9GAST|nr:retrovirus-related pol polyprotein from transposon 412 [Plakobranchus ocellatus]
MGIYDSLIWMPTLLTGKCGWTRSQNKRLHSAQGEDSEFLRMRFGLCIAPAIFSRVINLVLSGLNWESVLAFLDDVCVLNRSYEDHIDNPRKVFERFRTYGLRLKPRKCFLFRREVEFLERLVSSNGIQILPESIAVVQK